ncbi:superoxide dismutase [Mn], mitochondrial-like [Humulus lupulus]|uniref:superoxide dismutase [Mn], mitochondrial-like n=1 Tax=Humulus lupulus TaxID=3486 RepID=UPI002B417887|nr:superoxide dismutase [Mn], mitochondrial-like [Humulus lupulus]
MALRALFTKKVLASGFQTEAKALASGISQSRGSQTSLPNPPSDYGHLHPQKSPQANPGGHFNHSIFWKNLTPTREAGGEPPHGLGTHFGSPEAMLKKVKAEGAALQGSGLAYKKVRPDYWKVMSWKHAGTIHEKESFCRTYSSSSAAISNDDEKTTSNVLRPLSPHLPIYQPQLSSMVSIFNRISGSYLTAFILFNYLSVKIGWVSFTSDYFYQFMFYSSKLFPISVEIAALALSYHVIIGIQHLVKRA